MSASCAVIGSEALILGRFENVQTGCVRWSKEEAWKKEGKTGICCRLGAALSSRLFTSTSVTEWLQKGRSTPAPDYFIRRRHEPLRQSAPLLIGRGFSQDERFIRCVCHGIEHEANCNEDWRACIFLQYIMLFLFSTNGLYLVERKAEITTLPHEHETQKPSIL
jgi:hypothetical protein